MTNIKITSLPSTAAVAASDIIPVVDMTGPTTKRITAGNLLASTISPGSNTQVLFNDSGAMAGNTQFVFNKTTGALTVPTISSTTGSFGLLSGSISRATIVSGTFWKVQTQDLYVSGTTRIFINPLAGDRQIVSIDNAGFTIIFRLLYLFRVLWLLFRFVTLWIRNTL